MEKNVEFSINKITTEQFAVVENSFAPEKEISLFSGFRFGVNKDEKTVDAYSLFRFEQDANPFLLIEVGCRFLIRDESWEQLKSDNKVTITKGFITHLLTITTGTTRGVLHAKTEGSKFNQYLLPTINLAEAIKEDIIIDV
jgi:hypothetical protein